MVIYSNKITATENLKEAGCDFVEMWEWECKWNNISKKLDLPTSKKELGHIKCLIPRDAYFGGRTNAIKLYYKCEGAEAIHYLDVTSMYPYVMSDAKYFFQLINP